MMLKYLLLAILILLILNRTPTKTAICLIIIVCAFFMLMNNGIENMEGGEYVPVIRCVPSVEQEMEAEEVEDDDGEQLMLPEEMDEEQVEQFMGIPKPIFDTHVKEYELSTGLTHDIHTPKWPLIRQGGFEKPYMTQKSISSILAKRPDHVQKPEETPGYYLLNDNKYSSDGLTLETVVQAERASRYKQLLEQHNHNIPWSPHTHIGKARGYMNQASV